MVKNWVSNKLMVQLFDSLINNSENQKLKKNHAGAIKP